MASKQLINAVNGYENYIQRKGVDEQVIDALLKACNVAIRTEKDVDYGLAITERTKALINEFTQKNAGGSIWELERYAQNHDIKGGYKLVDQFYEVLRLESFYRFESFIYFMERKRNWSKRFYYPRRKTLNIVANDLEDLENRKIKFYGLSMPSRVGKSTICIFFLSWVALRRPNSHSAMGGHSGILAKGFYKELMNLFTTEEYTFAELFAYWHPEYANASIPTDKSADEFTITLGDPDRFATVTIPLVVGRIIGNEIRQTRFEGNTGGDLYCQYVDEKLQEQDYKCSCTSRKAPNKVEKLSKIIAYSGDVKRKFIFLDTHRPTQDQMKKDSDLGVTRYYRNDEYQAAMDELSMFVSIGGNDHDDAADGLTQLEMFIENPNNTAKVEAAVNPFRRY